MSRGSAVRVGIVAAVLVLSACRGSSSPAAAPTATTSTTSTASTTTPAPRACALTAAELSTATGVEWVKNDAPEPDDTEVVCLFHHEDGAATADVALSVRDQATDDGASSFCVDGTQHPVAGRIAIVCEFASNDGTRAPLAYFTRDGQSLSVVAAIEDAPAHRDASVQSLLIGFEALARSVADRG